MSSVSRKAVAPGCFKIVMNLRVDEIGAYSFLLLTITKHLVETVFYCLCRSNGKRRLHTLEVLYILEEEVIKGWR